MSGRSFKRGEFAAGQKTGVLYHPDDPAATATIAGRFDRWSDIAAISLFGLGCAAAGAVRLREGDLRRRRRLAEARDPLARRSQPMRYARRDDDNDEAEPLNLLLALIFLLVLAYIAYRTGARPQ